MSHWLIAVGGALIARVDGGRIIEEKHTSSSVRNLRSKRGGACFQRGLIFRRVWYMFLNQECTFMH